MEFDRPINAGRRPFGRWPIVGGGWFEKKKVPIGRARRRPTFATLYNSHDLNVFYFKLYF